MTFVVLSKYPIETMEKWAKTYFSEIPNKDLESPNVGSNPFGPDELGYHFHILRKSDNDLIQFYWPLDSLQKEYLDNPIDILSHLFGHEGNHSLFVLLKEEGLIEELLAGGWNEFKVLTSFTIKIKLTEKGFKEQDRVIEYVFAFIKMLLEKGIPKWVFDECQRKNQLSFQFKQKRSPYSYVSALANSL